MFTTILSLFNIIYFVYDNFNIKFKLYGSRIIDNLDEDIIVEHNLMYYVYIFGGILCSLNTDIFIIFSCISWYFNIVKLLFYLIDQIF